MSSATVRSIVIVSLCLSVGAVSTLIVSGAWIPVLLAVFGWYVVISIIKSVTTDE